MQAVECLTSPENQGVNAELTGNMPASAAGYDYPALAEALPRSRCSTLFQQSLDAAAPAHGHAVLERHLRRPPEHLAPAGGRRADTPARSQTFIEEVLQGKSLL